MITLFTSDVRQQAQNCRYPYRVEVKDEASLIRAVSHDYVCAVYQGGYRSLQNFLRSDCLAFDIDNDHSDLPAEWVEPKNVAEAFPGVEFYVHYSRSNMQEKNGKGARPKFHVLFPIEECRNADEYAALKQRVFRMFPYFDEQALDAARFFFGTERTEVEVWEGVRNLTEYLNKISQNARGEAVPFARETTADHDLTVLSEHKNEKRFHAPESETGDVFTPIPLGSRNSTLHRFAVKTLKRYGECERARELFLKEAQRCDPPLGERELRSIWQSAAKFYGNTIEASSGYVSPEDYEKKRLTLKPYDYTDIGQARVVVREYGDELCYTDSTDYLRYNGTYWVESRQQAVGAMEEFLDLQLADAEDQIADTVKSLEMLTGEEFDLSFGVKGIEKQAGAAARKLKDDEQEKAVGQLIKELNEDYAYRAFVLKRRDMNYVLSALAAAKPMVQRNITDLDRDEFLLNTPDATYDLRYGMAGALAHEPKNYITKVTAVNPSEKGKYEWLQALDTFFCGDAELIRYVQQIAGLAAIGKVFLEAIIIAYGVGRNGKSTFFNTVSRIMGTYAGQMSADTLTVGVKRNVKPEMAELKGKRLVIAAELEEGMRLNTSMIKQLCSTDEIFAEKKYKDPFRFIPSHTLVLYTNHLPKVGASDDGTWRRLIVIPFNAKIEGSSDIKNYTDYLVKNCGEYVLQWIIEGAEMVIANGFDIPLPDCVKQAIRSYRDNNDWLNNFLSECCEIGSDYAEKSGRLFQEYREYCVSNGEWARGTTDFYAALEQAGYIRHRAKDANYICGLRLK
nr:DUF5906 domain-containing protein [Oscillospiraceae bacterium]